MLIINSKNDTDQFLAAIENTNLLAIDVEFVRVDTYYPKLALIQIFDGVQTYIVDPLITPNMLFIKDMLTNRNTIKIFHAPLQDFAVIYTALSIIPTNIFDTQLAADLCGIGKQIGYKDLCKKLLNVEIDKENQFINWLARPLTDTMLSYCINDVVYLYKMYKILNSMLIDNSMLDNFNLRIEKYYNKSNYITKPEDAWKKVKFGSRADINLERMKLFAAFREECAMKYNMPRKHVISDNDLISIVLTLPKSINAIKRNRIGHKLTISDINKLYELCEGLRDSNDSFVIPT